MTATRATMQVARAPISVEWLLHLLSLSGLMLWMAGAHVDGWYHFHYGFGIESFLTWPHALLYGGFALTLTFVVAGLNHYRRHPLARRRRLTRGYQVALLGGGLFGLGGVFDYIWHSFFGFEVNLEALLTPAHLWLNIAFWLSTLGLVLVSVERRAASGPVEDRPRAIDLPVIVSLMLLMRTAFLNFLYSSPTAVDYASGGAISGQLYGYAGMAWRNMAAEIAGTTGILLHSVLLVLFLIVLVRHLRLPTGAIAGLMIGDALFSFSVTDQWRYLPAVVGAALVGEVVWWAIRRGRFGGPDEAAGYWLLAGLVPLTQGSLYFILMIAVGGGIIWTVHLWVGVAVMAGWYGLLTGLCLVPPRLLRQGWRRTGEDDGA